LWAFDSFVVLGIVIILVICFEELINNESLGEVVMEKIETRKPYEKPEVIHELELETRAGSPLSFPGSDLFSQDN
jgi:hypothetical protein